MKYLGTLAPGAAASVNNKTTTTPFSIPIGTPALELRTTAADVTVEVGLDAASPPTFAATAANSFPLSSMVALNLDCPPFNPNSSTVVAAYSVGGASVQVWALWGL